MNPIIYMNWNSIIWWLLNHQTTGLCRAFVTYTNIDPVRGATSIALIFGHYIAQSKERASSLCSELQYSVYNYD